MRVERWQEHEIEEGNEPGEDVEEIANTGDEEGESGMVFMEGNLISYGQKD